MYIFIALIGLAGSALLLATRAATPTAKFEAESATNRIGGVVVVPSSNASGGSALQFGSGQSSSKPPQLSGSAWKTVFHDDFSNPTLSMNELWELHPPFTNSYPGAVTVTNGILTMKTGGITNQEWTHISTAGPRRASPEPNYPRMKAWREGYFEARFRYTESEWAWPAFWLFSASKVEAWPGEKCPSNGGYYNAEWDMVENGVQNGWQHRPSHSWYMRVIHKNTTDHTADGYCGQKDEDNQFAKDFTGQKKLSDWHVWGGRWIGDELCTYLDNQLLNCVTAYDTMRQPMVINMDIAFLGECPSWCGARPSQLDMQVDWVKVWQQ